MKNIIITKKFWDKKNYKNLNKKFEIKNKLEKKFIQKNNPKYIFFIHWSKLIPENIYKNYNCIQFHSSNLPRGRGGSPIQNQILNGSKNTLLCAFRVGKKIDSGPIYLKKKLNLNGTAHEIFVRMEKKAIDMVKIINKKKIIPKKQIGKPTYFKRRVSNQSNIFNTKFNNLNELYNFIRMLDAESYPKAFIKIKNIKFEFYNVIKKRNKLISNILIKNENKNK